MALAGDLGLELVVLVGPRMAAAAEAAPGAVRVGDAAEVPALLRDWVRPGDHVLVKGSRAMGMTRALAGWADG